MTFYEQDRSQLRNLLAGWRHPVSERHTIGWTAIRLDDILKGGYYY